MAYRHSREAVTSRLRLRDYDYSTPGDYFVTICTQDRVCLFGDVHDDQTVLSTAGLMIESWWYSIPGRFQEVHLDDVVVMPNHIHGIIEIRTLSDTGFDNQLPSLSDILSWFKSITTNDYMLGVRTLGWTRFLDRLWQRGFYEHIVRDEAALDRIRDYIAANPSQWENDNYHPRRQR